MFPRFLLLSLIPSLWPLTCPALLFAKVPEKVEKLISLRRYYAAVQTLHHSFSVMEREGIQGVSALSHIPVVCAIFPHVCLLQVGALRDVCAELESLRHQLFVKTVDDLQHHLYNKGVYR